ncbi:hypothetical protein ACWDG9_16535 [Streptomyces sp. NPDC001073]
MPANAITLRLRSGLDVSARDTATPGLIVYDLAEVSEYGVRLAHHSGVYLAEFNGDDDAQAAARALGRVTSWDSDAESLQRESLVAAVIDIVEDHGGQCRFRKGGLGERVAAERREKKETDSGGR